VGSVLTEKRGRSANAAGRGAWPALLAIALLGVIVGILVSRKYAPEKAQIPDEEPARIAIGDELGSRLAALGHETREWSGLVVDLPAEANAVFFLAPPPDLPVADAASLIQRVERGLSLFVAPAGCRAFDETLARWVELVPDESQASAIPGDRVVPHEEASWRYREVTPEERVELEAPLEEIAVPGPMRVAAIDPESSILFAREGLGLVAEITHGDGGMIVIPDSGIFSDAGLRLASNAAFLASLVNEWVPDGQPVWLQK
jgi:hypothetical protein